MKIEVRTKKNGKVLKVIDRTPFHNGFVGNFVPHWVRYNTKEYLLRGGMDCAYLQGEPLENYIEV